MPLSKDPLLVRGEAADEAERVIHPADEIESQWRTGGTVAYLDLVAFFQANRFPLRRKML